MQVIAKSPLEPRGLFLFQRHPTSGSRGGGVLVATALAESLDKPLDKPLEWAVGFFFGNTELSLELWTEIAGLLGFDD